MGGKCALNFKNIFPEKSIRGKINKKAFLAQEPKEWLYIKIERFLNNLGNLLFIFNINCFQIYFNKSRM